MLDVAVASPERRPWADVTLWVEGVDQVPDGLQVTLVDERLGRRVDLRAERSYTFVSEDASQRPAAAGPRFRLLVGDAAFVDHGLRSTNRVVTAGVLQSAPNPFRSDARIRYGVGAQAKSELQIFDVSGRLLKTLASGVQGPGLYEVVWSGDTDGGERVGPGLYFARLTAPGLSETEKILRIR